MTNLSTIINKLPKKINFIGILTGSGISSESGIPTFRGKDGLWRNYKPEELATPYAFQKNPILVWEWYEMRRQVIKNANPNLAHYTIVEMEEFFENFLLVTQNVDGLHERAGSKNIVELHGNIWRAKCNYCDSKEFLNTPLEIIPPLCSKCGNILRPDVLWFGESYDLSILKNTQSFLNKCDVVFVIGSSGQVSVPVYMAKEAQYNGAFIVEINIEESYYTSFADILIKEKAAEFLPLLWKEWKSSLL